MKKEPKLPTCQETMSGSVPSREDRSAVHEIFGEPNPWKIG